MGQPIPCRGANRKVGYVDVAGGCLLRSRLSGLGGAVGRFVVLPAVQHYTAGSFDAAAHLMTASAQSVGEGLQFRNQCALLKLSLTGAATVERIVLTGNNGEYLAGPGERNDTAGMVPDQTSVEAVRWIRLDFDEGAGAYFRTAGMLSGRARAGICEGVLARNPYFRRNDDGAEYRLVAAVGSFGYPVDARLRGEGDDACTYFRG